MAEKQNFDGHDPMSLIDLDDQMMKPIRDDVVSRNGKHVSGQMIVDNLPQKFFIKDANLRYVALNEQLARDMGHSIESILGNTDTDLLAKHVAKKQHALDLEVLRSGKMVEIEEWHQRNGVKRWEKTIKAPYRNETGEICGILGMYYDITERKQAEEELRKQAETIQSMVESSHDWIWEVDLEANHTITNPTVNRILGYDEDELVGALSFDLMHEDDRRMVERDFPRWIKGKRGWKGLIIRWRHKDGSWRYLESNSTPILDEDGDVIGFRGVDRDITDRLEIQEKLSQALDVEREHARQLAIEMDLAANIQQAMMKSPPHTMEDLDICTSWIPAREMSGDFYKLRPIDDKRLGVWVGDVSAKGVPAGLLMALINAYLDVEMSQSLVPGNALSQLSRNVSEILDVSEQFTTLFLGILDASNGILTYSDAGHGHALVYRHASKTIEKLDATAPPLGIESQVVAIQDEVALNPHDILVIYSDGVVEAHSPDGECFGNQRLLELVEDHAHTSTEQLHYSILNALDEFREGSELDDDQTLVIIRRKEDTRSELFADVAGDLGPPLQVWTQSLTSHTGILQPLHTWVAMIGSQINTSDDEEQLINACQLAISELVTNVIKHAYRGEHGRIIIQAREYSDRLEFEIQDKGLAYEDTLVMEDDLPVLREGSYGLLITRSVMDDVRYHRTAQGVNCWFLVKRL